MPKETMKSESDEMKLGILVNAESALSTLANEKMKAKSSYRIAKVINQITPHLETFRKVQQELLEKYGKKNGEGFGINPEMKGWKTYLKEIQSVLEEDIDIKIKKITLNSLSNAELTALEIGSLDWLIEE